MGSSSSPEQSYLAISPVSKSSHRFRLHENLQSLEALISPQTAGSSWGNNFDIGCLDLRTRFQYRIMNYFNVKLDYTPALCMRIAYGFH